MMTDGDLQLATSDRSASRSKKGRNSPIQKQEHNENQNSYLSIVDFACAEQCLQRVISWDNKSCNIDEKLSGNVEENEEEVDSDQPEEGVYLGDGSLLLEIIE